MADFGIMFEYRGETVELRYTDNNLLVRSSTYGSEFSYIYSSFDKDKVSNEFPELINDDDWRQKAYHKLLEKLNSYNTDDNKIKYLINELKPYGYIATHIIKQGHRVQRVKYD